MSCQAFPYGLQIYTDASHRNFTSSYKRFLEIQITMLTVTDLSLERDWPHNQAMIPNC